MPISIKTDLEWGSIWYIINDPEQLEYQLIGVKVKPGKAMIFELDHLGEVIEVYDFQCSETADALKQLKAKEDGDGDIEK